MSAQPGRIGYRLTDAECEQIEALIEAHSLSWLARRLGIGQETLEGARYGGSSLMEATADKISAGLKGLR